MKTSIFFRSIMMLFVYLILLFISANGQVQCLRDAWRSYNNAEAVFTRNNMVRAADSFIAAINFCNLCITQFAEEARNMQRGYGNHCPPVGTVSAADKEAIFKRWALNDVSTACFIKGKSAKYLLQINRNKNEGKERDLQEARTLIRELSKGRCWDPQGWFWSPCRGLLGDEGCCQ